MESTASLPAEPRILRLVYEDPAAFREQYSRNLSHGGGFVPTAECFEPRELVEVSLEAPFADETLRLRAEVVHQQPRDGVSVQFLAPAAVVRVQLATILERARALRPTHPAPIVAPGEDEAVLVRETGQGAFGWEEEPAVLADDPNEKTHQARAVRHGIRMGVRVRGPDGVVLTGLTRNVSASGLLLSVPGERLEVGSEVALALLAPSLERPLEVSARVVRQLQAPGIVPGVAVQLHPSPSDQEIALLVEDLASSHGGGTRRALADRFGAEGAGGALRLIAALARGGTVAFASGTEEALFVLESERLLAAELGPVKGLKALARVLSWPEGSFELTDEILLAPSSGPALPIGEAIDRALELAEQPVESPVLAADARFVVHLERLEGRRRPLSEAETSVLDRAAHGFTLRRILDFSPESDASLLRAISSLRERGVLSLSESGRSSGRSGAASARRRDP